MNIRGFINTQKYCECRLVSLLNCYQYLTGKKISPKSNRYESLVDLVGARYGGAISIQKAVKELGLKVSKEFSHDYSFRSAIRKNIKENLPVDASTWHKRYGFHSVAILDYCRKTDAYLVSNFKYETSLDGWIFVEDFEVFTRPCGYLYEVYKLK